MTHHYIITDAEGGRRVVFACPECRNEVSARMDATEAKCRCGEVFELAWEDPERGELGGDA